MKFGNGVDLSTKKIGGDKTKTGPQKVEGLYNIKEISCGDFHSLALDKEGKVYSWGGGGLSYNKGQLGLGHTRDIETPTLVESLCGEKIVQISAGGFHSLALTEQGLVYSWGSGIYGENGVGEYENTCRPT